MNNNFTEIERKFLIKGFPTNLPLIKTIKCHQAYLSINPEVRIRKEVVDLGDAGYTKYLLTIKSDGTITRKEVEIEISENQFNALLDDIRYVCITKEVRVFELPNDLKLECSHVDEGFNTEFFYAEVEFPDEATANSFEMLPEFVKDVSSDPSYKMKNYWKRSRLGK